MNRSTCNSCFSFAGHGATHYSISQSFYLEHESVMRKRTQHVRNICETQRYHPKDRIKLKKSHIFLDHKHKVLFCTIPKVSGTSWKKKLLAMNSMETYTDLENRNNVRHRDFNAALKMHNVEMLDFHKHTPSDLKTFTKIMFVRDPIERLISAFNDKFHPSQKSNYYFKKFGKEILTRYQSTGSNTVSARNVTFEQFVTYIVDLYRRNETYRYDEHWDKYYNLCLPCHIDYDIIGE